MLKSFRAIILLLSSFLGLVLPAYSTAELQSIDDPYFGVGSITYDTETGLEWLDLTYTAGMSYNDVMRETAQGGLFEGFSRPTYDDVSELFCDAGIELCSGGWQWISDSEGKTACARLASLLGDIMHNTYDMPGFNATFGCPSIARANEVNFAQDYYVHGYPEGFYRVAYGSMVLGVDVRHRNYAHFLVRLGSPAARLEALRGPLSECVQSTGTLVSLMSKLSAASKALDDLNENNDVAAINKLQAFINAVEAQSGKHIPEADAAELISAAQGIIDSLQ